MARWYDALSLEWPVYRPARLCAIAMLELRPGERVLDVGCGTGLSLAPLRDRVGSHGQVVGVDRGPAMLAQASRRVRRHRWQNVDLVEADVTRTQPVELGAEQEPFDAAIAAYALSLMPEWRCAWNLMVAAVRPGGRIALVELGSPRSGGPIARRLARVACDLGGSVPRREPWRAVEADLGDVRRAQTWAGHVTVRAGTKHR